MQGSSINDEIGGMNYEGENSGNNVNSFNGDSEPVFRDTHARSLDLSFLKAPTGEGSIESYLEHPLNFNSSRSMARIIRGLSGMLGSLDLAIVDIGIGLLDYLKPKKVASHD